MKARNTRTAIVMIVLALGLSFLNGTAKASEVDTQNPEAKASAVIQPSTVYLEMKYEAWVKIPKDSILPWDGWAKADGSSFTWASRCSGFSVSSDGYIVTAGHCIDPDLVRDEAVQKAVDFIIAKGWAAASDRASLLDEGESIWRVEGYERNSPVDQDIVVARGVATDGLESGKALPARVVDLIPLDEGDVALLKIEASDLPVAQIADGTDVTVGTDVLSVGYPASVDYVSDASFTPSFKDGQINQITTREGGLAPVYQMSAPMSGGMSGGPTVNMDGQVVGLNSYGISGETEAFNFITPASLITEIMGRNGVDTTLSDVDTAYRAGIDAYFAGRYEDAIAKFDTVLDLVPSHEMAQSLKTEAVRQAAAHPQAEDTTDQGGSLPVGLIAGVAVALVAVAGGVVLVTRRRGTPVATADVLQAQVAGAEDVPAMPVGFQARAERQVTVDVPAATRSPEASASARFCASCGAAHTQAARFCQRCGTEVA